MNSCLKGVSARIDKLSAIISEKTAALQHVPEGILRVSGKGNYAQYYVRSSPKDKNGTYISVKEKEQIRALAQKEYDTRVLHAARKEQKILLRFEKQMSDMPLCAETVYSSLDRHRQELVDPIELPEDEYARQWKLQSYIPKAFAENTPEHYTAKGERVRSKSEVLIADTLAEMGIPYLYEKPFDLGRITIYPDFTLLRTDSRKTLYLEHLGMMDNPEYAQAAINRIHLYIRHQIIPGNDLILTFETKDSPLNRRILHTQLSYYFN